MKLKFHQLDPAKIKDLLFSKAQQDKRFVSIKEMIDKFTTEVKLQLQEIDAQTLSRYLIEDNYQEKYLYDEEKTQVIDTIQSIFMKVIGSYKLQKEQEEQKLFEKIQQTLVQFKNGPHNSADYIINAIKYHNDDDKEYCSPETIKKAFNHLEIFKTNQNNYVDYIILRLFKISQQLYQLDYKIIPQLFDFYNYQAKK